MEGPVKRAKSPPLAFVTTSNDALWAPFDNSIPSLPSVTPPHMSDMEMQAQIDKQSEALFCQHQAFMTERESWQLEKERLYRRISDLESLLKTPNGHSPARSPVPSPQSGLKTSLGASMLASIAEDKARLANIAEDESSLNNIAGNKSRLASVSEDDSNPCERKPLLKRDSAPTRIDLPSNDMSNDINLESPPSSPPVARATLSPPPLVNRHLAGHTPLKGPRLGHFSPVSSIMSDRLADTPTRSNTLLNEALADGETDQDRSLKGPLHMPELPSQPGEENFTMDMLSAKLKDVMEHPEDNQPIVCIQSPDPEDDCVATADGVLEHQSIPTQTGTEKLIPVDGQASSTAESLQDADSKDELDNGGIKLRKAPSSNFGAPLGQLGPWKQ